MPTSYIVLITVLIILLITGWFPHYNGLMILVFWKLSFKPASFLFSLLPVLLLSICLNKGWGGEVENQ